MTLVVSPFEKDERTAAQDDLKDAATLVRLNHVLGR